LYKKISDYGIIGNLRTVALIGLDGSIDWLCLPFLDSPSAFGALLDDEKGGRFRICPQGEYDSVARYISGTNILVTSFRTSQGTVRLTDFMPVDEERARDESAPVEIYRHLEAVEGRVDMELILEPRCDYARAGEPEIEIAPEGVVASGGGMSVLLASELEMEKAKGRCSARWTLQEGQRVWFRLSHGDGSGPLHAEEADRLLTGTSMYWKRWLAARETGRSFELGQRTEMMDRSALVLKLLHYAPTGAIAAAATTSLPEVIGGERNWDYRYTWVRDASFTLQALFDLGHLSETENYLKWMEGLMRRGSGVEGMKIMYGLRGEEDLREVELGHLDGYKGSRPVRIGNGAAEQVQLDIYGELLDASLKLSDYVGKISSDSWPFLRDVCSLVVRRWREPDAGIWEIRGGPYHFVYSKLMCWVALDRGITIAGRYGFRADLKGWQSARKEIRQEILERGWSSSKQAFRQHYDTDALDASVLLIPVLGFLPPDDPRVVSTVEAVGRELGRDGFIYRYVSDDGLEGSEGSFLLCTLWYIDSLILIGRIEEAEMLLRRVEGVSSHLGLFSEEYDVEWIESLGNFPQAFTHIGYINSVMRLIRARARQRGEATSPKMPQLGLYGKVVLNSGEPPPLAARPRELGQRLKQSMNVLRGAFFDTSRGRVVYELMRGSEAYHEYLRLSYALRDMDLAAFVEEYEKLAFWINLYNVAVIHGVVELGVKDSVKEVRGFFRRVVYDVGGMEFSLEDMEHGILRCNRRPPGALRKRLRHGDERRRYRMRELDPRVHFALVCASSSCPPIGVYTPEGIDAELDIAAGTFVNSGGAVLDREAGMVSLSSIFKWYARDFGRTNQEMLRFVAGHMYEETDRVFLLRNLGSIKVRFQQYDWRLNRS
jgi:GH15 family glucan-1,4-alpha-glucosidase